MSSKPSPKRTIVFILASFLASAAAGIVTFGIVAAAGQGLDPSAPGDQYLFLGFVTAAIVAPTVLVLGIVATWFRTKTFEE